MKEIFSYISFTKGEIRVIIFLITVLTSGFGIKYYRQVIEGKAEKQYDYSGSDNEFSRLSGNINRDLTEISDSGKQSEHNEQTDSSLLSKMLSSGDSLRSEKQNTHERIIPESVSEVVNINTATKEQLVDLPGIGESTAEKIISYRNGKRFAKTEDIMNVKGIGKKKFENIKSFIKTE